MLCTSFAKPNSTSEACNPLLHVPSTFVFGWTRSFPSQSLSILLFLLGILYTHKHRSIGISYYLQVHHHQRCSLLLVIFFALKFVVVVQEKEYDWKSWRNQAVNLRYDRENNQGDKKRGEK